MHFSFRNSFGERVFRLRYAQGPYDSWPLLVERLVDDVCGTRGGTLEALLSKEDLADLRYAITEMLFIPGGRYLYYAGRPLHFFNNCFCLDCEEDTREEWGNILKRASDCLMSGGGIGINYSRLRGNGEPLKRTGGIASGPIPLMHSVDEIGHNVMQGGSRRSAIFASLLCSHPDIRDFIALKNWPQHLTNLKLKYPNFKLPMEFTNISVNWDTSFLEQYISTGMVPDLWHDTVLSMCQTGEPGHCYNFLHNEKDTLRNACGEFTSEDDSDVCNLGSINFSRIKDRQELQDVTYLASKFLVCGTLRGDVPYAKIKEVRSRNRKIGLGLMGIHEWLLARGETYRVTNELRDWLRDWKHYSEKGANDFCDRFFLNRPKKYRAIAPAGTIGILAGTTTGIEPLFGTAYLRGCIEGGSKHTYQYVVDSTARHFVDNLGINPDKIETASDLAKDPERRLAFQAEVQSYVDMGISSTVNLPSWGSPYNNEDTAKEFSRLLLKYAPFLRGVTTYPNGARSGQPLTVVPYKEAILKEGVQFDAVEDTCSGGVCGI